MMDDMKAIGVTCRGVLSGLISAGILVAGNGMADIRQNAEVQQFVREMHQRHGYVTADLEYLFSQVSFQESILNAMARPYEVKPWHAYKKLFLTPKRIAGGQRFMQQNRMALQTASQRYGVPASVVTAIIGIETSYGENPGKYRVMDALSTLAFAYPKRADFFRRELEAFLLLCREEKMAPEQLTGSYAGAMGFPQFMPSSFRGYAVDGNGDGRRDIWQDPADAIASVAHYLARNGWVSGEPVAVPARLVREPTRLSGKTLKAEYSLDALRIQGVKPLQNDLPGRLRANLVALDETDGKAWWLGFRNFYAITRYNHSALYAMAAHQLSQVLESPADTTKKDLP
jgi:membrane-bound lytic murein transglycosylase B